MPPYVVYGLVFAYSGDGESAVDVYGVAYFHGVSVLIAGPYYVAAGQVYVSGAVVGSVFVAGAAAGQVIAH